MQIPASAEHLKAEFERVSHEDLVGYTFDELCEKIAEFNVTEIGKALDRLNGETFSSPLERLTRLVVEAEVAAQFGYPKAP